MTIKDKIREIINNESYTFCGIDFALCDNDYIRIYDKVDGKCIYTSMLHDLHKLEKTDLLNKEYKKEELIKLPSGEDRLRYRPFAVCFYLDAPEKIEGPISARVTTI